MATLRTAVSLRPDIASLPAYVPGERPSRGRQVYKLSSNEVPFPLLPTVAAALADVGPDLNRYPDMYATQLVEALADHHGIKPERVTVGNGSVAVLAHVLTAVCEPGDEVVMPWRSFEAYPIAVQVAGARAVQVPVDAAGRHDLDAMAAAVTDRTRAVLLCSPNNPTGPALTQSEVRRFLETVPPGVLVVLDEAYLEFVRQDDPTDGIALVDEHKNLVVLRTFSKAYGLAGLRVGYAVARRRLTAGFRATSTPFGVNAMGLAGAVAALGCQDQVRDRVEQVVAERTRVTATLAEQGWDVPDAQGNFVWLDLGRRATSFAETAKARGVLVRAFAGEGVRVSFGEREGNDLFLDVAADWLRDRSGLALS
ncbi:histidinol-phosphate transaminase [Georgenia sp. EYE_87]|uniref:histidinol-phosphate transaminase n=1 Tax=Georgenia sp. EYE_87 TaxID=2853448 RepID=UPI002006981D|nr:histidinol-phosphate transaminase [Georgenia sp. EYE_87]MCK6211269.1 histidinol-phosphate transaminase [Georgenia sp. EYE_87]